MYWLNASFWSITDSIDSSAPIVGGLILLWFYRLVVVADNILRPGAPEYRKFVNAVDPMPAFDSKEHEVHIEHLPWVKDIIEVSTVL